MAPSPVTASPDRRAWLVVALLWVAFLINYVDRQVVFSIFPALKRDIGFTDAELGLIGTVFVWIYSLCNPLVGKLADTFSRTRLIVASILLWSLATLATGLADSVWMFLVCRAVMGVTEALYVPPALGVIGTLHSGATRSRALALHGSAQFAGIVAGSSFGGYMADGAGWRWAFYILAVVGLCYAPVLWWVLRPVSQAVAVRGEAPPATAMARNGCYLALCFAFFCLCIMLWMIYAWMPTHLYEKMGLSMKDAGVTGTFWVQVGSVAGVLLGGALGDWGARRWPSARFGLICIGLACCSPLAYLALATSSLAAFKVFAFGFGLTAGWMMGNNFAATYDVTPRAHYGIGAGTLNMIGGISGGAAIYAAGRLKDSMGIHGLMFWGAAMAVFSAVVLAAVVWRRFDTDRAKVETGYRYA
jgi:predicted MFS family arabinose efflux permease